MSSSDVSALPPPGLANQGNLSQCSSGKAIPSVANRNEGEKQVSAEVIGLRILRFVNVYICCQIIKKVYSWMLTICSYRGFGHSGQRKNSQCEDSCCEIENSFSIPRGINLGSN